MPVQIVIDGFDLKSWKQMAIFHMTSKSYPKNEAVVLW